MPRRTKHNHLAEVLRPRGWMLSESGKTDEAERVLRSALAVAREQGRGPGSSRVVTTLAGLLEAQGDVSAALQLVEPVYASFEEGLDTPDLVDAASLIRSDRGGQMGVSAPTTCSGGTVHQLLVGRVPGRFAGDGPLARQLTLLRWLGRQPLENAV